MKSAEKTIKDLQGNSKGFNDPKIHEKIKMWSNCPLNDENCDKHESALDMAKEIATDDAATPTSLGVVEDAVIRLIKSGKPSHYK